MKKHSALKIAGIFFLVDLALVILFVAGGAIAEESGLQYQSWVEIVRMVLTYYLLPLFAGIWLIFLFQKIRKSFRKKEKNGKAAVFSGLIFLMILLLCGYFCIGTILVCALWGTAFPKESHVEDQVIQNVRYPFWGEDLEYTYYRPVTIFFEKQYIGDEGQAYQEKYTPADNWYTVTQSDTSSDAQGQMQQTEKSEPLKAKHQNNTGSVNTNTDFSTPEAAALQLYNTVLKAQGYSYTTAYDAKGNFYAVLGESTDTYMDETMQRKVQYSIVTNGMSQNNACQVFVMYKTYYAEDGTTVYGTGIVDFYAVNCTTGQAIDGQKTSWAELGTEEYQDATTK